MRAAQQLARPSSRSPRPAPRWSTSRREPRRCSRPCRRRRATTPATCSAAFNGCAATTRSPRPARCCWRRRASRSGWTISTNGGSNGGCSPASCSTSSEFKLAYQVARDAATPANENYRAEHQFTAGWIALRFLHDPANRLAPLRPHRRRLTNPITLARAAIGKAAPPRRLAAKGGARPLSRRPRAIRPPITARSPAPAGLRRDRARAALPRTAAGAAPRSKSCALSKCSTPSTSAISSPPWSPISPTRRRTPARWRRSRRSPPDTTTPARCSCVGKTALGRGLPFEHYAFPDHRPAELQADRTRGRTAGRLFDRAAGKRVQSARRLERQRARPDAGDAGRRPLHRQEVQRRLRPEAAARTIRVYNVQIGTAELGDVINDIAAPTSWPSPPTMPAAPGEGVDRAVRRSARSEGRSGRLGRAHPVLGDAQLRAARDGEPAGLSRPLRQRSRLLIEADLRRGG